jgi:CRP/FNR family transcriptional regulator
MSGPLFVAAIAQAPSFRQFIFGAFTRRVPNLLMLIEESAFYRLDQRLAALLLSQGLGITTTHQMLADELGSVRGVISRILRSFAHQTLVRIELGVT